MMVNGSGTACPANEAKLMTWFKRLVEVAEEVEEGRLVDAYIFEERRIGAHKALGTRLRASLGDDDG
jgi:hypothetical protein